MPSPRNSCTKTTALLPSARSSTAAPPSLSRASTTGPANGQLTPTSTGRSALSARAKTKLARTPMTKKWRRRAIRLPMRPVHLRPSTTGPASAGPRARIPLEAAKKIPTSTAARWAIGSRMKTSTGKSIPAAKSTRMKATINGTRAEKPNRPPAQRRAKRPISAPIATGQKRKSWLPSNTTTANRLMRGTERAARRNGYAPAIGAIKRRKPSQPP